jgi:tetratricopeptide (TPR) repeat protein
VLLWFNKEPHLARLTRHELKKDELGAQLGVGLDYFMHHKRPLLKWIGIGAAALVIVLGIMLFLKHRNETAAQAFGKALDTYHAAVSEAPAQNPNTKVFKTDKERLEASITEFTAVTNEHSGTAPAWWAKYYIALCNAGLDKYADAEKQLQELISSGDTDQGSAAKMALAGVYELQGRNSDAEKLFKELIDKPTRTVAKATAQMALADLYRTTNPAQARTIYQELAKDFPETSIAELANLRIGELPAK